MKVAIIGAGPAGCYAGFLLARKGHQVTIYDKKARIGEPVQCTGILSDYFEKILQPDKKFILNAVQQTRIHSPDGKYLEAKIKRNYIVDRKLFDMHLAAMAENAGAKILMDHCLISLKGKQLEIKTHNKILKVEADIIIGADGPQSTVAKQSGLMKDREYFIGIQIEAKTKKKNDNVVDFFPYIGCYSWIVPLNKDTARIGTVSYKDTNTLFKKFRKNNAPDSKVIENQSGIIPLFNPKARIQKRNVFLIGDAAGLLKATTGGGIVQALMSAKILSKSFRDYEKNVRRQMYMELYMHLLLHKMMLKFSASDWNYLVKSFNQRNMRHLLYAQSRDQLTKMMIRVAMTKPSLLKLVKHFPVEELRNIPISII